MSTENADKFIEELSTSILNNTFVKATFGNYRGNDPHLQKLLARQIETKKGRRIFLLYRFDTRDTAKNYPIDEGLKLLRSKLGIEFFAGHLFTTKNDFQLDIGKKGKSRLNCGKPTFHAVPEQTHDREKRRVVDPDSFYLKALGIANDSGSIKPRQQQKWKQINKFVETLGGLFDESDLNSRDSLSLVDMGSGKGYLTFAAYDYFRNTRDIDVTVTGIDSNERLIELCSAVAESSGFTGLSFKTGTISDVELENVDILVALHACDTATDDALFKGIRAAAELIVASPCCHKEIRPQIKPPDIFIDVLKHGTLLERQSEILTDGLRSLLLEKHGYSTKVFEFVPTEHTPKNNLIAAVRTGDTSRSDILEDQISRLKSEFGIETQRLRALLS